MAGGQTGRLPAAEERQSADCHLRRPGSRRGPPRRPFANQVAPEIWQGRAGRAETVAAALTDYLAQRRRNLAALTGLRPRFADLAAENVHDHLGPFAPWCDFIRRRLLPDPPTS